MLDAAFLSIGPPVRCVRTLVLLFVMISSSGMAQPHYHWNSSRKIVQITADWDPCLLRKTQTLTQTNAGVIDTDLGISFEHKGRLYFLFGDTEGRYPSSLDCMAWANTDATPTNMTLTFPLGSDGKFKEISIPGVSMAGMEAPTGGLSCGGNIYITVASGWYDPTGTDERSVLARSVDDYGTTWTYLYDLSNVGPSHDMTNTHFINVSMSIANSTTWPGLPYSGDNVLLFGTGLYRKSNVYLAALPAGGIETKSNLRFFSGLSGTTPTWSTSEAAAAPLTSGVTAGEFSCQYIPQLSKWVMLYTTDTTAADWPGGVTMRSADKPWGNYANNTTTILFPWWDDGYGRYIHVAWDWTGGPRMDCIDPGSNRWGGIYGPYLIPRWTTGDANSCQLFYTLSTWNPYDVIIVRSEVGAALPAIPPDSGTQYLVPGDSNWTRSAGPWFTSYTDNGEPWISTYSTGDGNMGVMYQWLPRDMWNKTLSLKVHHGTSEVMLIEGGGEIPTTGDIPTIYSNMKAGLYGEVVQCTWGVRDDIDTVVNWDLRPFDRKNLKVVVIDAKTSVWSSINVSRMTLTRNAPQSTIAQWPLYD